MVLLLALISSKHYGQFFLSINDTNWVNLNATFNPKIKTIRKKYYALKKKSVLSVKHISSQMFIIIMPHRYYSFYSENIVLYILTVKQDNCNTLIEICIFLNTSCIKKKITLM